MLEFGLSERIIEDLRGVISSQPHINRVDIYGSRARGDYTFASDIDLAVYGDDDFTFKDYLDLIGDIDDLPIIFKIDVLDMNALKRPELQDSISKDAIAFCGVGK